MNKALIKTGVERLILRLFKLITERAKPSDILFSPAIACKIPKIMDKTIGITIIPTK